ncbi:hypothetical protein [Halopelagius longus]|uniref:Uncharacterized protein n=1 Tax=Halopelagius longus TaxID=1236180 RepID=A0A1H1FGX4_9EURY|nr:hypothetical protein [Halopelagius longus]RDI70111.1 hypothetical protein DWB78_15920 [Halopelagius longus]SDR00048.1 hypothetical protein SAMN05216278_3201 [Halopelagius longus]
MTKESEALASAVEEFHEEVPHRYQVSLTMSMETRERVSEIRDELNDAVEDRRVTTNDAMRIALLAASRYHAVASGDVSEPEAVDEEQLLPLASVVRRVVEEDGLGPAASEG